jgi:hypothetical protein
MAIVERFLHEHFASVEEGVGTLTDSDVTGSLISDSQPETLDEPFAKVNSVAPNSPAEAAGLKPNDEIRNFGYVSRANHDGLKKVAECVQGNEGVSSSSLRRTFLNPMLTKNSEQHLHPGFAQSFNHRASGAAVDTDTEARLGRSRLARMSHTASIEAGEPKVADYSKYPCGVLK